jgi:hypothetical protein
MMKTTAASRSVEFCPRIRQIDRKEHPLIGRDRILIREKNSREEAWGKGKEASPRWPQSVEGTRVLMG